MSIQYKSFKTSGSAVLPPNRKMVPGQFLQSPNGRYRLELQPDGHLVIKDNGAVIWKADKKQAYSITLTRKLVGPPWFVVSNGGFLHDPARSRLWIAESTHSRDKSRWGHSHMSMQDDGNLTIYDNRNGDLLWARFGFQPGRIKLKKSPIWGPYTVWTHKF